MAPRSFAAQHPSSRSPTLSPDDLLKLPALYCGGNFARFVCFIQNQASAGRRHPSTKLGRSSNCCCTARSLVTLNVIEGIGRKKTIRFCCSSLEDAWLRWLARKPDGFLSPYGRRSYSAPTLWRATFQLVVGIFSCFHRNRCLSLLL